MDKYSVIIIGSGAAGYSTADWLRKYGIKDIALITENRNFGTSRNAGSDKQTYYKMSFTEADSAEKMADVLSSGGGMHKDTAFIEAVNSTRCFLRLADYGVPFPTDILGRYIGYKTDHDDAHRGTSAGPLTSKYMTECLENKVMESEEIEIIDNATVIKIVKQNNCAAGVICLKKTSDGYSLVPIMADYVVMATGGAANVYKNSVYPVSQSGAMGLAVDAGCRLNNLTEWQYGIASTKVRWNLSGSYQQVMPAYYSVDEDGNKYEFLPDVFNSDIIACNNIFLKGYQWPFDSKKIDNSSLIDLAVSEEIKKGRRVFIDFRRNPKGYDFNLLSDEVKKYLTASKSASGETPIERLKNLNQKSINFYKDNGIDLEKEPLEISVCAQHMNGGVDVDCNWQTSVERLFAVGETAGTFGMYRPGGSALNSTQVGGLRIAEYISANYKSLDNDENIFINEINVQKEYISRCLSESSALQIDFSKDMSDYAAHCRIDEKISILYKKLLKQAELCYYKISKDNYNEVRKLYKYKDNITFQLCLCKAMLDALPIVGSRGGAVYYKNGRLIEENIEYRKKAVVTINGETSFVDLRPAPDLEYNFEQEWLKYCKRKNSD